MQNAADFEIYGTARIHFDREHLRGTPQYLTAAEREQFASERIAKMTTADGKISRSDTWYRQYYRQPYMETFTEQQFHSRWADVWDNLLEVGPGLKLQPNFSPTNTGWVELFSDLIAESQFRGGFRRSIAGPHMQSRFANLMDKNIRHLSATDWNLDRIYKFGELKYVQESFDRERIRFARSELYASADMNRAQKDDENTFEFSVMPTFLKYLNGLVGFSAFEREILPNGLILKMQNNAPYLVCCASSKYRPTIPNAFDYDSVLVIKDRRKFQEAVVKSIKKCRPASRLKFGKVHYMDPYLELNPSADIRFSKHHRFSYQHEYRMVIGSEEIPEFEFIDVPGLQTFSEVVRLKN